jgi:hypothetical protein
MNKDEVILIMYILLCAFMAFVIIINKKKNNP